MAVALVTGGAGFIGANLAARLIAEGDTVHLLVRPGSNLWRLTSLQPHVLIHEIDVRNREAMVRVCETIRPSWVFHLAAFGNSAWEIDTRTIIDATFVGSVNVFDAARHAGCKAIVHAGSSSEYGLTLRAACESDRLAPNSEYAVAKAAATLFGQQRARANGDPIVTLRFYSVYGPWEDPARLLPTVIVRGLDGEWPPLAHPAIARDFVHVDDAVEACLLAARAAMTQRGEVFNVCTGIQSTLADVVGLAQQILPNKGEPPWEEMASRAWDTTTWVGDARLIGDVLGWRPEVSFDAGFRRFVRWFEDDPARRALYRAALA